MVALDLDGTALDPFKGITEREERAFRCAIDMGVHIVVATGRAFHSLPEDVFRIDGIEYAVTSNGARVIRLKDRSLMYENCIGEDTVLKLVEMLRGAGVNAEACIEGRAYIDRREFEGVRDGTILNRDREYVLSTRTPVDDIFGLMEENRTKIENINLNYFTFEEKEKWVSAIEGMEGITLTSSLSLNSEIGGATTSKADGLLHLMEELGVTAEELMACGDSLNDGAMIKMARVGVAMGNASAEVREMADYVTATNAEDGVAKAIEKFVLGRKN